MADSPAALESNPPQSEPGTPNPLQNQSDLSSAPTTPQPQSSTSTPITVNPNLNPPFLAPAPPPPVSYAPPPVSVGSVGPPAAPSFRPVPQFSPIPNPNYQNLGGVQVQPPGVSGSVSPAQMPVPQPQMVPYQLQPGQPPRPYPPLQMPNGYPAGTIPPPVS